MNKPENTSETSTDDITIVDLDPKKPDQNKRQKWAHTLIRRGVPIITGISCIVLIALLWPIVHPLVFPTRPKNQQISDQPATPTQQPEPTFQTRMIVNSTTPDEGIVYLITTATNTNTSPDNKIEARRLHDGVILWTYTGAITSNSIYVADGILYVITNDGLEALRGTDKKLLWKFTPPGSSLEFSNGYPIYQTRSGRIVVLHPETGSIVWERPSPYSLSRPFSNNGVIFFLEEDTGIVNAIRVEDGTLLWKQQCPLVTGSQVTYRQIADTIVCSVVTRSGNQSTKVDTALLQQSDGSSVLQLPEGLQVISIANNLIYAATQSYQHIYALSSDNGSVIWQHKSEHTGIAVIEDVVYLYPSAGSANFLIALRANDGTQLWQKEFKGYPVHQEKGAVYIHSYQNRTLSAYDIYTGQEHWNKEIRNINLFLTASGSRESMYGYSFEGNILSIKSFDSSNGKEQWKYTIQNKMKGILQASLATNVLLIYSEYAQGVEAIHADTGKQLWSYQLPENISVSNQPIQP